MNSKIGKTVKEISKSENENLPILKPGFERLRIWQKAYQLMLEIHKIAKNFPFEEKFRLRDQVERSSSSVVDAIAEGYSTYYYNDKIKSFYLARREAGETQNHCKKMQGKGYIAIDESNRLIIEYEGLIRGINALINRVKEQRDGERQRKQ